MRKYLSLYILLLLCLKVNACFLVGLVVSKKDIDLAKSIVKINYPAIENENVLLFDGVTSGSILK